MKLFRKQLTIKTQEQKFQSPSSIMNHQVVHFGTIHSLAVGMLGMANGEQSAKTKSGRIPL